MFRYIALTITALAFIPRAHAQPAPAPLLPPILVPNVTPPLTIPSEVVAELQNGRILCERKLAKFDINLNHLKRADFNGDGTEDFILSTAGYLCNNSNTEFASLTGDEYFIFSSLPDGKYQRHPETIRAFEMSIDTGFTPPHLLFSIQCPHKFGREFTGHTRLRWNGDQLKAVTRNAGCDGTAPDASIAAAAPGAPPAEHISSGPQIKRSKAPSIELDITNIDENTVAAENANAPSAEEAVAETPVEELVEELAEEPVDVTTTMTPDPITPESAEIVMPEQAEEEPPAPAEAQPDPAPIIAAAPPAPAPAKPVVPATLPGATFPAVLTPAPQPPSKPATLSAEDLLSAPAKPATPNP